MSDAANSSENMIGEKWTKVKNKKAERCQSTKNTSIQNPELAQGTTTMDQLLHAFSTRIPPFLPLHLVAHKRIPGADGDEVYPHLYIGDAGCAKSPAYLKAFSINYILNTAEGSGFGQVDTGHHYYNYMPTMRYMGLQMADSSRTNIAQHFYAAANFIDKGISSGGCVLVHCLVGRSRSATCVLAYLMIYRHMTAVEALRTVLMYRNIRPNNGFLRQLIQLDNDLKLERAKKNEQRQKWTKVKNNIL